MIGTIGKSRTAVSDDWWDELDGPVLNYLARQGAAAPDEIARAVGMTPTSVVSILALLAVDGKVCITRVEPAPGARRAAA
jgi:DNA-binding Lrp family transcriptional regulator